MKFPPRFPKRQLNRYKGKQIRWQSLESLETRLLMAADMSTILIPLASETGTVQVDLAADTDMNSDGRVDVADLGILGSQFNVHAASSGPADVNKDQVVDVTDLGMLGANWTARPLSRSPVRALNQWGLGNTDGSIFNMVEQNRINQWNYELTGQDGQGQAAAEFSRLAARISELTNSHSVWLDRWASRYMALATGLRGEMEKQTNVEVMAGFGTKYSPGKSEIFAFRKRGATSFAKVHTYGGATAAISELNLERSSRIEAKLQSVSVASDLEVYIYSARFGAGPSHVGVALAQNDWVGAKIVFLPVTTVKADGLSVKDAVAFVGHQLEGKVDFTDFIKNRHGQDVRPAQVEVENPISHAMRQGCNYRELEACSAQILDTLESALHEAKEAHKEAVNKIMNQYGEDMAEGVIGAVIAGAVAGGIAGAAAAGPPGALAIGFFAALAGIAAALGGAAMNADEKQEALDEADADYADAVCQAKSDAIIALVECIREHCPDLVETAERWAEQQIELEDCVWR